MAPWCRGIFRAARHAGRPDFLMVDDDSTTTRTSPDHRLHRLSALRGALLEDHPYRWARIYEVKRRPLRLAAA